MKLIFNKQEKTLMLVNDEGHVVSRPGRCRKMHCTSLLTAHELGEALLGRKLHIVGRNGLILLMDNKEMEIEKRGWR